MKWVEKQIIDLCESVCSGGTPSSMNSSYYNGDIPWLNTKEVNFNRIFKTESYITDEGLQHSSAKWVKPNTVIVAMYGATAGRSAISKIPLTTNQACCNLTIDVEKADYNFVYYALCYNYKRLQSIANGGAQQNLNADRIKRLKILCPDLSIQKRISSILSHYDDLIEINKRRIALLEESARELYKEWFVRMRFPGWRKEKTTAGIPSEWEIKNISQICDISAGKDRPEQVSLAKSKEFPYPIYSNGVDNNGLYGFASSPRVVNNCITISARGTIGFVVLHLFPFVPIVRLLVLVPQKENLLYYLYLWAKCRPIEGNGTSQQQLTVPMIGKEKIIIPTEEILDQFNTYINELVGMKDNLIHANELLSLQRDRLLPRLMSGQLEV